MTHEPAWIDVPATSDVHLRALSWGPDDAPIALCLHGFPDTANGWSKVAPQLVDAGWRVVAPFMRGYGPSSPSSDGSYHVGALMDDALRVLEAAGPTGRDVVIGHDWGAVAATGLAAMPDSPFTKAVVMSVPPVASFRGRIPQLGRLVSHLPRQVRMSWYALFFQLPWLPERSAAWIVPRLWRRWDPAYDAREDVALVLDSIGPPENWRAALGYYRATIRLSRPPARYAALHKHWMSPPVLPTLYLHGADDGAMSAALVPWVGQALPHGSTAQIVPDAGHFIQADQPDEVARLMVDFLGNAASPRGPRVQRRTGPSRRTPAGQFVRSDRRDPLVQGPVGRHERVPVVADGGHHLHVLAEADRVGVGAEPAAGDRRAGASGDRG